MATFTAEGNITRTWLSLSDLTIAASAGYYIQRDGFGPGETSFRRSEAESIYVNGKYMTHAVKDQQTSTLKIRVVGATQTELYSRMDTLAKAMEQFSFTLDITIGDKTFSYECDAADYAIGDGGQVQDIWARSSTQMMTFDVPHKPTANGFV